jgi:hypothetical protein
VTANVSVVTPAISQLCIVHTSWNDTRGHKDSLRVHTDHLTARAYAKYQGLIKGEQLLPLISLSLTLASFEAVEHRCSQYWRSYDQAP